jgi:hypothetical protein
MLASGDVEEVIADLSRRIGESAQLGPRGPHLGGYHFIPDWDSWGIGNPKPIMHMIPDGAELSSLPEVSIENFKFEA